MGTTRLTLGGITFSGDTGADVGDDLDGVLGVPAVRIEGQEGRHVGGPGAMALDGKAGIEEDSQVRVYCLADLVAEIVGRR